MSQVGHNQIGVFWGVALVGVGGLVCCAMTHCVRDRVNKIAASIFTTIAFFAQQKKECYSTHAVTAGPVKYVHKIKWEGNVGFREVDGSSGDCFYISFAVCLLEWIRQKKEPMDFIGNLDFDEKLKQKILKTVEKVKDLSQENLEKLFLEDLPIREFVIFLKEMTAQALEEADESNQRDSLEEYKDTMKDNIKLDQFLEKVRRDGWIDEFVMPFLFKKMNISLSVLDENLDLAVLASEELESCGSVVLKDSHYRVFYRRNSSVN